MRTILFRGYDAIGNKGWVYGDLVHNQRVTVTGLQPRVMVGGYEVLENTVGQFTGLMDKNGKKIFEGDIFCRGKKMKASKFPYHVCYQNGSWVGIDVNGQWIALINEPETPYSDVLSYIEVIGNMHENPILLTDKQ